ncbi:MAG: PilZ domain-containing protein [Phycisphaerae bacterium]
MPAEAALARSSTLRDLIETEISRFLAVTRHGAEGDLYLGRRRHRRHYRTWPLLVARLANLKREDLSVSLANASAAGLAFRAPRPYKAGSFVAIKLFWHDPRAYRVPAIVRHCRSDATPKCDSTAFLIGCEFALADDALLERVCEARLGWYDA